MNVFYDAERGAFRLDTPCSSYIMALADGKWLGHVYYGPRLTDGPLDWVSGCLNLDEKPYTPERYPKDEASFFDRFPAEYPASNVGDFRECCLGIQHTRGTEDCSPEFHSCDVLPGKPALEGLPATFGGADACNTLKICLEDQTTGFLIELYYTAFTNLDVITRSVRVVNRGTEAVHLDRCLSSCLHLPYEGQQMVTLHGSWARERGIQVQEIACGFQGTSSHRGISSHQEHPFLAVISHDATQERGDVYAMHFVYSGNFLAQVQRDQFDQLRLVIGIHPAEFSWKLKPGATFQAPEVVLTYSGEGLGGMTRTLHDLYRGHLIRKPIGPRPVLINNWEATYFDFDEDRLLEIAERAAALGIELFVLDDGWFENRPTDSGGLGDWKVDRNKLPSGLDGLGQKIEALGMRFGLWMEPEMVSEDSDLYRAHPDWAIQTGRRPLRCRDQLVLDLGRREVEEYVWQRISETLHSAPISYLKWDMNRPLTNLGSSALPQDQQGEVSHRYVLALYRLQQRLMDEFPDLLLENCCSGGGRFDPGMLYYSPQIWCSDDTDAIERLRIQEGTAMLYPLSCMGSHVSVCPNHIVGRMTPFQTRSVVAMAGTFGYELDVTALSGEEQTQIPEQISQYRTLQHLLQSGDYYRIASAGRDNGWDCQMVVSKNQDQAAVYVVRVLDAPNQMQKRLRLQGLDFAGVYEDQETHQRYPGDVLCNIGLAVPLPTGDFQGKIVRLLRV